LAGSAVFPPQQDPIGSAVVVNNGKTASRFASSRIEKGIEPVTLVGDLHPLEGRGNETPSLIKIIFQFLVSGQHTWVGFGQIDERTSIEISGA
jgi:hypothetical protein